ncbi:sialate O-acetylesterase [Desulfatitalea tepidiphila]|uniref:sialate O-acetylesterase n=1 Tax=Desulfatitalea tepidiphila TaxID=1185843 RepID=UPI0013791F41|nr:sialate O-acetylesterase [Desulfatitalea tepidiphila]
MLILVLPVTLGVLGVASPALDDTPQAQAPLMDFRALMMPEYYRAWGSYLDERLSLSGVLTRMKRWVDYRLFSMTDVKSIHVGREGWLFQQDSIASDPTAAIDQRRRFRQMIFQLTAVAHLVETSGRRLVFTIAPDKAKIYPEYLGYLPKHTELRQTDYDIFLDECKLADCRWFIPLDDLFMAAKSDEHWLYDKHSAVWNQRGARLAAEALLNAVFEDDASIQPNYYDLGAQVMGAPIASQRPSASQDRQLSSLVLYGGMAMNELIPNVSPYFSRTDAIATDTIPSPNHGENMSHYDAAMVVLDGTQIDKFVLDLDRICNVLDVESLAQQADSIPLITVSSESQLSLRTEGNKLEVKSLGSQSAFLLPPLPGSEPGVLRVLVMELSSPNADTLRWHIGATFSDGGEKQIFKGDNRLYFPLPVQPSVRLRIHPGRHTGLFYLNKAMVLEYANGLTQASLPNEDQRRWPVPAIASDESHMAKSAGSRESLPAPAGVEASAIQLHDFDERRIFQRSGKSADIVVSGVYRGRPDAIEARVSNHSNQDWATPWTVIDNNPTDGVFMGIMPEVPQGGWYRLAVRFSNDQDIMDVGKSRWGVGLLAACIGQSNMKEWFHSGSDLSPHSLLSVHRDSQWIAMGESGNGAIALGNRLIGRLGIPVGLLDYAVNGSGLRKEADWGAGYWLDRSHASIYNQFIQGVAKTGGMLEYVIWMQGEADAARATISERQYRNALKTFLEQHLRQDIVNGSHLRHLPLLIVGMPKRPVGKDGPHQAIRAALHAVAEETEDCYLSAISMDLPNMGRQHLTPSAYTTLGLRVAQTILYLNGEESYYRGPSVVGATRVDTQTIDIRIAHRGGFDFNPRVAITGWELVGGGSTLTTAQIARRDADTIRISMSEAFNGPITIRYLSGAMPDANRAVHDNSPMELPLEPAELTLE